MKSAAGVAAGAIFGGCGGFGISEAKGKKKPNVIVFITDDQGYGDLGCHGNKHIKTPNFDSLYQRSVRLKDYHVGPTCAPTRASLMTGKYCNRVGVWHTIAGRSLLKEGHTTLPQALSAEGYKTGLFGKWHLGDNYPARPQDRGFDEVLRHGAGGVGQTPDYWGNDYFNDTYFRNGKPEKHNGYCSDVWFDEAIKFIDKNKGRPFFTYLSTNAPHGPYRVHPKYVEPYKNNPDIPNPEFYGMIANLDENLGRLVSYLRKEGLEDDTLLIFMGDNGTAAGYLDGKGFNAGMRGKKGSQYDGGHRVACFLSYPAGGVGGGRDIEDITSHIDIMPTILDICGSDYIDLGVDGISLLPYIKQRKPLPNRVIITDSQRVDMPIKWRKSAVMTNRWRLVDGERLYDIKADPRQMNDIAEAHRDVVKRLRAEYDKWWQKVGENFDSYAEIVIGTDKQPCTVLTAHDWHPEPCTWHQRYVRAGRRENGSWSVRFARAGVYEFELRRWPREAGFAINEKAPTPSIEYDTGSWPESKAFDIIGAKLEVDDRSFSAEVLDGQKSVNFRVKVDAGSNTVHTELKEKDGGCLGAYYVYVTKIK